MTKCGKCHKSIRNPDVPQYYAGMYFHKACVPQRPIID